MKILEHELKMSIGVEQGNRVSSYQIGTPSTEGDSPRESTGIDSMGEDIIGLGKGTRVLDFVEFDNAR